MTSFPYLILHNGLSSPSGHGRSKAGDAGSSDALEGRREAFSYLLTLLRQGGGEGAGLVPAIDVAGMEHLAWTLDALLYLLEVGPPCLPLSLPLPHSHLPPSQTIRPSPDSMNPSPRPPSPASLADPHTSQFFRRSNSTVCLGSLPASPFDPLHEALPLAEKPHLLDSAYSKQQLFGFDRSSVLEAWPSCDLPAPPILHLITAPLPGGQRSNSALGKDLKTGIERGTCIHVHLYMVFCGASHKCSLYIYLISMTTGPAHLGVSRMVGVTSHELAGSVLLGRWASTVELFGRVSSSQHIQSPVCVGQLVSTWKPWARLKLSLLCCVAGVWGDGGAGSWLLPGAGERVRCAGEGVPEGDGHSALQHSQGALPAGLSPFHAAVCSPG